MRWREGRRSENVEDRRGMGGGGMRFPMGGGGLRLGGGTLIVLLLGAWLLGANPLTLLSLLAGGSQQMDVPDASYPEEAAPPPAANDEGAQFVSVVLADTEDVWTQIFASAGQRYEDPKLVLFTDVVRSACGMAQSAMGPFYCPLDHKVYIDLGFYRELRDRFQAPGDFAQAYVIAHEVGHHVQTLIGTSQQVHEARQSGRGDANELSVRLELQADCYAGVWAHHANRARSILEEGDVEEGLNAAAAIGDDRIQRQTQGTVVPESFTHGSSSQRVGWFRRGLEGGNPDGCDTFSASAP